MHCLFKSLLCLISLLVVQSAVAAEAEVVWTKFNGKQHQIIYSAFDGKHWQNPGEVVYQSPNPLATPVVSTLPSGQKLLIWAETIRNKTKLMFTQSNLQSERSWTEVDLFSDLNNENLAPTVVTDLNDHVWVFWSSSSVLPSDIYLRRFDGVSWNEAERVHAPNLVPDNAATASLNSDGSVYLEWNTFDFEINNYRLDSKTFIVENPNPEQLSASDVLNPADIPLPDFIGYEARAIIHFPSNKLIQSQVLNK